MGEKHTLVVATFNRDKFKEYKELLGDLYIELLPLYEVAVVKKEEFIESGESFEENACIKAKVGALTTNLPTMADDSGLMVDYLGGAPGIYSARFSGLPHDYKKNNEKLLIELKGVPWEQRKAKFVAVIGFCDPKVDINNVKLFKGVVEGFIGFEPKGGGGFGYDPLFYVPQLRKTFAELSLEEKNKISHRAIALCKFKQFLKNYWNI